jgi:TolB-like protein
MFLLPIVVLLLGWYGYSRLADGENSAETVASQEKSVVVLPFLDFSPDKDQEWFADGLTDELLNSLSRVQELRVIARTTSFALKGKDLSVQKIADSLNVNYLVEGSIQKVGNKVKVIAQLIDPKLDDHIWSNTFEMEFVDIFKIQEDIAEGIANTLNIYFDDETRQDMFATGTKNADAYEAYLRGNKYFNLAHSEQKDLRDDFLKYLDTANTFYQEGIRLDPNFAAVYYKHQDLYTHYLIHYPKSDWPVGLTEEKVIDIVRRDFSNAEKLAKTRGERIFYELENATISNDWSAIPILLDELESNEAYLRDMSRLGLGWTSGILISADREDVGLKILGHEILSDPLNRNAKGMIYIYLTAQNKLDSARAWHKKELDNDPDLIWELFHAPEKLNELLPLIKSQPESYASFYAAYLTNTQDRSQLDRQAAQAIADRNKFYISLLYAAMGEQHKADSIVSGIDTSFLGPTKLSDFLHLTQGKIHFSLAAAPNFAARLKEAGITDLAAYEEEHRLKFK